MPEISLEFGIGSKAVVSTTGAALLELSIDSKHLITKAVDPLKVFAGSVLAPWQNRLAMGEWVDDFGQLHKLPINEPDLNNAHHGLVFDSEFSIQHQSKNSVVLETNLASPIGYPFNLSIRISYHLDGSVLTCEFAATNDGDKVAPFVIGFHPYFSIGKAKDAKLTLPAQSFYTQNKNKIPIERQNVSETGYDFRAGKTLDGVILDDTFTDFEFVSEEAVSVLETSDWKIELSQSANLGYAVVYLTDSYESEVGIVSALALEPASGPPNAFNSKDGLVVIEPASTFSGAWSVRLAAQ
jgi:aldose 1-epimerase